MGNCNMGCCRCIEKKETNQISTRLYKSSFHKNKLNKNRSLDISHILIDPKDNTENKKLDNHSLFHLNRKEEKNKVKKNNNEKTNFQNYKDISFKHSRNSTKDRFYSPNNRYINNNNTNDNKDFNEYNKEEDFEIIAKHSPTNSPRNVTTNFKTNKNTHSKYFDKIEECKKNLDMTENNKNKQNKMLNNFPIKYNEKNKYINYFTDDNI